MKRIIWTFWTDINPMSDNRKRCLDSIIKNTNVEVSLITAYNLKDYEKLECPIHPSYEYLSAVHRSDYLRTYWMHHFGGGYTDIKDTNSDWNVFFDKLEVSKCLGIGYTEIGPGGVANVGEPMKSLLKSNWKYILGNGAYIWKPGTKFTSSWLASLHYVLDLKYEMLKKFPANNPRDHKKDGENVRDGYPIKWTELLGNLFHPLCYEYKNLILHGLVPPSFTNYQ